MRVVCRQGSTAATLLAGQVRSRSRSLSIPIARHQHSRGVVRVVCRTGSCRFPESDNAAMWLKTAKQQRKQHRQLRRRQCERPTAGRASRQHTKQAAHLASGRLLRRGTTAARPAALSCTSGAQPAPRPRASPALNQAEIFGSIDRPPVHAAGATEQTQQNTLDQLHAKCRSAGTQQQHHTLVYPAAPFNPRPRRTLSFFLSTHLGQLRSLLQVGELQQAVRQALQGAF